MDKEQARFILQSFRPDGADAKDPDFAEALAVAAEDRELGRWLADERAQDGDFATALSEVELPDGLREHILEVLLGEEAAGESGELDASLITALAEVQPPDGLRDQIVTAMKVEHGTPARPARGRVAPVRRGGWLKSAALAAAIVLGAFVAFELTPTTSQQDGTGEPISLASLEHLSIARIADGPGELRTGNSVQVLNAYLGSQKSPTVRSGELPPGLSGVPAVGCRLLKLGEKKASLLCFDKEGQAVHLVVVRRQDLGEAELATLDAMKKGSEHCWQCPKTKFSVASWGDDDKAFVLLSRTDPDLLLSTFF